MGVVRELRTFGTAIAMERVSVVSSGHHSAPYQSNRGTGYEGSVYIRAPLRACTHYTLTFLDRRRKTQAEAIEKDRESPTSKPSSTVEYLSSSLGVV